MTKQLSIIDSNPIIFSITPESLIEIKKEQDNLIKKVPDNIEELEVDLYKKAKGKVRKLRTATEKERKDLKAAALSYGRLVDSESAKVQKPIAEIENVYDKLISEYDAHFDELARIAAEKEEERISEVHNRLGEIRELVVFPYHESHGSNDVRDRIKRLIEIRADKFNYQEFEDDFINLYNEKKAELAETLGKAIAFEANQEKIEARRKLDEEKRIAFEAEKAAFESKQKDAQDKIDADLAAIQKQKDIMRDAENQRIQKEREEHAQAEFAKQQEELKKQRAIDEEKRKQLKAEENARLEKIKRENESRRIAQEKEDRVRNAAPELLDALEGIIAITDRKHDLWDKAKLLIKSIKGE